MLVRDLIFGLFCDKPFEHVGEELTFHLPYPGKHRQGQIQRKIRHSSPAKFLL